MLELVIGLLLPPAGALLTIIAKKISDNRAGSKTLASGKVREDNSGYWVLGIFSIIVVAYGIFLLIHYWDKVVQNKDSFLFAGGLFLVMAGGMFVQVIISNYRAGDPLLTGTAAQFLFPLLLSPIVFYAIWSIAASATKNYFVVYCAFLNGYFWESTVSKVKPPSEG